MDLWIETYTGKKVNPLQLKEEDISIMDIAHALSLTCRFNGHCSRFYSVAAHSLGAANLVGITANQVTKRAALLHDATEAYLPDVPRPIKHSWDYFKALEEDVMSKITNVFLLHKADWQAIKKADNIMLAMEAKLLMSSGGKDWNLEEPAIRYFPIPVLLSPETYEHRFLVEYSAYRESDA